MEFAFAAIDSDKRVYIWIRLVFMYETDVSLNLTIKERLFKLQKGHDFGDEEDSTQAARVCSKHKYVREY